MKPSIETSSIMHTLKYVKEFYGTTIVVKLGGSVLHNPASLDSIFTDILFLHAAGIKVVLVHGGGKTITEELTKQQIPSTFVDGLRVTSKAAMHVIESVLCDQINLALVDRLTVLGLKAIGLSGADNNILTADYFSAIHGCVGVIKSVNTGLIDHVLSSYEFPDYMIPVIAPIGVDEEGNKFNINADYAACYLANALQADKLIYLTDQDGIMDKKGKNISLLSVQGLKAMIKDGTVEGGMLTKVKTIICALSGHLNQVHILSGNQPHALLTELFTQGGIGTMCYQVQNLLEAA